MDLIAFLITILVLVLLDIVVLARFGFGFFFILQELVYKEFSSTFSPLRYSFIYISEV